MRVYNSLILVALLAFAPASFAQSAPALITITGEGQVEAPPDMATISLGVTTTAQTAQEAMSANAAEIAAVLENLKATGIEARDLQTSGLSLQPNWTNRSTSENRIDGYTASNQLSVRVRDLSKLGAILDAAVKDGANTLNGVSFAMADPAPLLEEARKRAVADARSRAELIAGAAEAKLGAIASITEGGGGYPQPQFGYARAAMESVPVEAGAVSLSASVTMSWQLVQ